MKLALIDLGSNSARMYILKYTKEFGFEYLKRRRLMTRLSGEMTEDGVLKDAAIVRTLSALSDFAEEAKSDGASVLAVATAAVRNAKNSVEFCDRVYKETGIILNVISGETEAFFDFMGATAGLEDISDCLITDTGGGSTEIISVKNGKMYKKTSLPAGAMNICENFGNSADAAYTAIEKMLKEDGILGGVNDITVIGLGGSVSAVAALDMRLKQIDFSVGVHGYKIKTNRLNELINILKDKTPEERMALGIEKGRADTVCAGLLPSAVIADMTNSPELIACSWGLREGILQLMSEDKTEEYIANPQKFMEKFVMNDKK